MEILQPEYDRGQGGGGLQRFGELALHAFPGRIGGAPLQRAKLCRPHERRHLRQPLRRMLIERMQQALTPWRAACAHERIQH